MFTGIVEEVGRISSIKNNGTDFVITISANIVPHDVRDGDSISVNGVCLTVTSHSRKQFTVDVMPETLYATNLQRLTDRSEVNLERAMAADGRFGGHFVSGHIDATGKIVSRRPERNAVYYEIEIPEKYRRYLTMKGSVAVDGTSLTIFGLRASTFTISLIPHTLNNTILGGKKPGDSVNIECDSIAKYVEQFVSLHVNNDDKSGVTLEFLKQHDF